MLKIIQDHSIILPDLKIIIYPSGHTPRKRSFRLSLSSRVPACVWNERFLNGCTTLMGNVTDHRMISGHLVLHTTGEEITSNKAFQLQDDCSRSLNDNTRSTAVAYVNVPLSHLTMN